MYYNQANNIDRDYDNIIINNLGSSYDVSDFIRTYEETKRVGYEEFSIQIDAEKLYPNAVVPLACYIQKLKQSKELVDIVDNCGFGSLQAINPIKFDINRHSILGKVWKFENTEDVNNIVNGFIAEFRKLDTYPEGVLEALHWALYEVLDNVIQHSMVSQGLIMGQIHRTNKTIAFTVADLGIGIFNSFKSSVNHKPRSPIDAICLAIQEGITRDNKVGQGNGLFGLYSIIKKSNGGSLNIISDSAWYTFKGGIEKKLSRIPVISTKNPGTIVDFQLNYKNSLDLKSALVVAGKKYELVDLQLDNMEENPNGYLMYRIKEKSEGTGTRISGERARNEILNILTSTHKHIVIDFESIELMSSSFADELIAKLLLDLGLFQFNNVITISHLNEDCQYILQRSVIQRFVDFYKEISNAK